METPGQFIKPADPRVSKTGANRVSIQPACTTRLPIHYTGRTSYSAINRSLQYYFVNLSRLIIYHLAVLKDIHGRFGPLFSNFGSINTKLKRLFTFPAEFSASSLAPALFFLSRQVLPDCNRLGHYQTFSDKFLKLLLFDTPPHYLPAVKKRSLSWLITHLLFFNAPEDFPLLTTLE